MDIDGDGILSMYELEYFYEEQLEKMQRIGIETLSFNDCLCQVSFLSMNLSVHLIDQTFWHLGYSFKFWAYPPLYTR